MHTQYGYLEIGQLVKIKTMRADDQDNLWKVHRQDAQGVMFAMQSKEFSCAEVAIRVEDVLSWEGR